jgi:hypothetical protein
MVSKKGEKRGKEANATRRGASASSFPPAKWAPLSLAKYRKCHRRSADVKKLIKE